MKIAFVAFYLSELDGVGALRSRCLANLLEQRGNNLVYFTKNTFGEFISKSKFLWCCCCCFRLLREDLDKIYVSCSPFWHLLSILLVAMVHKKKKINC